MGVPSLRLDPHRPVKRTSLVLFPNCPRCFQVWLSACIGPLNLRNLRQQERDLHSVHDQPERPHHIFPVLLVVVLDEPPMRKATFPIVLVITIVDVLRPRLGIEAVCQDGRRIHGESKRRDFRSGFINSRFCSPTGNRQLTTGNCSYLAFHIYKAFFQGIINPGLFYPIWGILSSSETVYLHRHSSAPFCNEQGKEL